jgi:hypothetical protein
LAGRHAPRTNGSFYLSVATSTLRFAIVVALVVGGVAILANAFPDSGAGVLAGDTDGTSVTTPPPRDGEEDGATTNGGDGQQPEKPDLKGVTVVTLNGTSVIGLAAAATDRLEGKDLGLVLEKEGNAETPVTMTTLYFRGAEFQDEAELLARRFFDKADVAELPADASEVRRNVDIAIYLGTDYAT